MAESTENLNDNVMEFDSETEYSIQLLRNQYKQYKNKLFCDLDLIATDNTRISVHQNVLAASSCYFNAMLSSGMKENEAKDIHLKDVNGEVLRLLIDFCYSGKIETNSENVEMLLAAASRYEFVEIEQKISEFLEHFLKRNPMKCLAYYSLAYLYEFDGLKELSKQLLCEHFMKLKDTEEFLLLKFDQLFEVIKCDDLSVSCEEDIYNTVMMWINYDKANREKFMNDLLKVIRFTQMDAKFLVNEVVKPTTTSELKQIFKDVLNYKIDKFELRPASLEGFRLNPRRNIVNSDIEVFAFLQPEDSSFLFREIYSKKDECWKMLAPFLLPMKETIHTFVMWRHLLFICGDRGQIIGFNVDTLDIVKSTKTPTKRQNYAVTIWNDSIYILGGMLVDENEELEPTKSIEKYDIQTGIWSMCAPLTDDKGDAIATIVNDTIYCAYRFEKEIECIELNNIMETSENKIIQTTGDMYRLFSHNNQLYAQIDTKIQRFDSAIETWTEIDNSEHMHDRWLSNQLFRADYDSGFKIEKYCSDVADWTNYGKLSGEYSFESNLFLHDNKV